MIFIRSDGLYLNHPPSSADMKKRPNPKSLGRFLPRSQGGKTSMEVYGHQQMDQKIKRWSNVDFLGALWRDFIEIPRPKNLRLQPETECQGQAQQAALPTESHGRNGCPGWMLTYWKILEMFRSYEWILEYETVKRSSSNFFLAWRCCGQEKQSSPASYCKSARSLSWLWCTVLLWNHNHHYSMEGSEAQASSEPKLRVFDVKDGWFLPRQVDFAMQSQRLNDQLSHFILNKCQLLSEAKCLPVKTYIDIPNPIQPLPLLPDWSKSASPATQGMPLKSEWKMDDPDVTTKMWIRGSKSCRSCQSCQSQPTRRMTPIPSTCLYAMHIFFSLLSQVFDDSINLQIEAICYFFVQGWPGKMDQNPHSRWIYILVHIWVCLKMLGIFPMK